MKDIVHERAWVKTSAFAVEVKILAETRNRRHSRELFKTVVGEGAKGIFQGKIIEAGISGLTSYCTRDTESAKLDAQVSVGDIEARVAAAVKASEKIAKQPAQFTRSMAVGVATEVMEEGLRKC